MTQSREMAVRDHVDERETSVNSAQKMALLRKLWVEFGCRLYFSDQTIVEPSLPQYLSRSRRL